MKKNPKKFLVTSFTLLIILCVVIFIVVAALMRQKSNNAIGDIGRIYMSEINRQLQEKFTAAIEMRSSQLEGLIERTPPGSVDSEDLYEELKLNASVRGFSYLGIYAEDGTHDVIYGDDTAPVDEEEFLVAIRDSGWLHMSSGLNKNGEKILLLVRNAAYTMKNGETSVALVAGVPMDYVTEVMFRDENGTFTYSHIVRKNGDFVIRSIQADRDNYFVRLESIWPEVDKVELEDYIKNMKQAMESKENYSVMIKDGNSHKHVYCSSLPESEWYLITIMPYGIIEGIVGTLGNAHTVIMLVACLIIVGVILVIFFLYYGLSKQQMAEMERAKSEAVRANMAKSEFLSNMSHDIRTPMNGIVGMTAIAMTNINDSERVQDCLKKITLSSKHLLGLINDILDMSKIESGKLTLNMDLLSLRETMESIVNIIQPQIKAKHQHFDIFIQQIETEEIYCDGVRLNQILINLLSNAIKFTPESGRISVYLSQEPSPLGVNYVRCHFRVKDSGIGMSPEFQKVIFDTFTRETDQVNKIEGTGLGMAITKCIVEAMDGTIDLTSKQGHGSEFHITLDLEKADLREEDMILPPWNILVVDNNRDLCVSAVSALKEIGINADYSLSGKSAIQMVERQHEKRNDYQLVLIDWRMPEMDGLELTRRLRKKLGEHVPILIISAYDWSDIEDEALEAGAHGFISKPLFKSNLYLGLSRYMGGNQEKEEKKSSVLPDFTGKYILLAEDNELNWEIANEILTSAGFKVDWAENGQVCVEKFEESEPGTYDVVLMDIRMPVMNGYDAAKSIRALDRPDAGLPIIAMTADAFSDDVQRALECGMNVHIAKPIDINRLMQELNKYLS